MSKAEVERLRSAILVDRKRADRARKPFDREIRSQVVAHAVRRCKAGESVDIIANSLGLKGDTLRYWLGRLQAKPVSERATFRRVRVAREQSSVALGALTLWGPGGTRLEGLTSEQVLDLWRRLS